MHISDGILPARICLAGYAFTGLITRHCLKKIRQEISLQDNIPKASLLTAAFFTASLIHIPIPPTSIHLVLNGAMGSILGYFAFPAILIGLFFQAVMFHHGGLTVLGVNALIIGLPALFAHYLFRLGCRYRQPWLQNVFSFCAGAGSLAISAIAFTLVIITCIAPDLNSGAEQTFSFIALGGYGIQSVIEGFFAVMLITFLRRVKPEMLPF